ncbi:MAG TPA: beta-galactosidase trimerization domain-containing protein, partial [Chloroflexota bacterium]|nr:beta-galactosidase trimerization domain-containing protein [Chloroflexota bacterium]
YGMDGSRTPRSEMVSRLAKWATAPEQSPLWAARPIRGEIGIVVVPESQLYCYAQQGNSDLYARSVRGAYQGFFENNIQADWVHPSDIDQYRLLYLPFPIMLDAATAGLLKGWVAAGGTLIAEGCPGYFGDRGRVGTVQPNLGLDEVFGARESYVEFTPDLLDDLNCTIDGLTVRGGGFFQTYVTRGGTAVGWYADGAIAAVDHHFGRGHARLIGTFPGLGYSRQPTADSRRFFGGLLEFGGQQRQVRLDEPGVAARLHASGEATYLWVINHNREARRVELEIASAVGEIQSTTVVWGDGEPVAQDQRLSLSVGGRDATIVRLR